MFCLFSTLGLSLSPFRGRTRIYTGSPCVGKAPAETPVATTNCQLDKKECLQRAGRCTSQPSWSSRTEVVSSSGILQSRICFCSGLLCLRETHQFKIFVPLAFNSTYFPFVKIHFSYFLCSSTLPVLHTTVLNKPRPKQQYVFNNKLNL